MNMSQYTDGGDDIVHMEESMHVIVEQPDCYEQSERQIQHHQSDNFLTTIDELKEETCTPNMFKQGGELHLSLISQDFSLMKDDGAAAKPFNQTALLSFEKDF